MNFRKLSKILIAATLGTSMLCGQFGTVAMAADTGKLLDVQHTFSNNGYLFEKISHASTGTEQADGVVDYMGNHNINEYVDGVSETGKGDSVQSYSYCAAAAGDWVYIGTMYGALSAYNQATNALTGMGFDADVAHAVVDAMFNGKLNKGREDDGYYAGSVFFKFNVVTGESKLLMSREMYENNECEGVPIFRSATEYNGKLYFVGLVSQGKALNNYNGYPLTPDRALDMEIMMQTGVPSVYELDPATDELKKVYECVDVNGYRTLNAQNVFTSTRAISTFSNGGKDYLIAGGIVDGSGADPLGCTVYATDDPSSGDFKVIANQKDLFDYPAFNRLDSEGGGGIYQTIQFGDDTMYVVMVSGRYNKDPELDTKERPFAIVRGKYDASKGAVTDKAAWTWSPLVGDQEKDGAKYTFGIDPERTASGAATLQVYNGYLYIGEYNDVNGGLTAVLQNHSFNVLAKNLTQSINLYRMDADENMELVVGDATKMFPKGSITGWKSGYETHMTQYTWMTTVFDDTMYLSTMDETSLLHTFAQFVNGEVINMSEEEWESQINYLKVLIHLLKPVDEEPVEETAAEAPDETEVKEEAPVEADVKEEAPTETEVMEETLVETEVMEDLPLETEEIEAAEDTLTETEKVDAETKKEKKEKKEKNKEQKKEKKSNASRFIDSETPVTEKAVTAMLDAVVAEEANVTELTAEQTEELTGILVNGTIDVEEDVLDEAVADSAATINSNLDELTPMLNSTDVKGFSAEYESLLTEYMSIRDLLPEELQGMYDLVLNIATRDNIRDFLTCMKYMVGSKAGFDLYAIRQDAAGKVNITTVSNNGFGDRYNHGLRIFAATDDYMTIGTANPFLGTQLWRMAKTPYKTYGHTTHHFDEGTLKLNPSGKNGKITYTCEECGYTITENYHEKNKNKSK